MSETTQLRCFGGGRDGDNPKLMWFAFNRAPTDQELRFLVECMQRSAALAEAGERPTHSLSIVSKDRP